jgi:hypothetical protein
MSDRPRVKRKDPERSAPIRNWSNLFRSAGAPGVSPASGNGAAMKRSADEFVPDGVANGSAPGAASAAPTEPVSEEAQFGIESAYRVIDEHLREGQRAAQARSPRGTTTGLAGAAITNEGIQEIAAQAIRLYSSMAPLWSGIVNSMANAGVPREPVAGASPSSLKPVVVEIASPRMARVTVDLPSQANPQNLAIGGMLAVEAEKPPLKDVRLAIEPGSNRVVVRIRVPDDQPAGAYSGVIVERESGESRGTITVRIEA